MPPQRSKYPLPQACRGAPDRSLPADVKGSWRASGVHASPLPRFFLHADSGANFSAVARALRGMIGRRKAEEVIPIAFSQYLVDMPLVEALLTHPRRVMNPREASWHILAALPFASRLLALLDANVSASGKHFCSASNACQPLPSWELMWPPLLPHRKRMHNLETYLAYDRHWRTPNVPFVLIDTSINIGFDLPPSLMRALELRNRRVGPVILAGVDRSGPHAARERPEQRSLLKRMVLLPHVATPEATHQAQLRGPSRASIPRRGFFFAGDHGRFDYGARGAVRDYKRHLRAPHEFRALRLMLAGGAFNSSRAVAHLTHRRISQATTERMVQSRLCFAPQGDSDTSRRLCARARILSNKAFCVATSFSRCCAPNRRRAVILRSPHPFVIRMMQVRCPRRRLCPCSRQGDRRQAARGAARQPALPPLAAMAEPGSLPLAWRCPNGAP